MVKKIKKLPKKELEKYKKLLVVQRAKMLKDYLHMKEDALNKSQKDASGDLSGYSYHLADMASGVYETDFMLRLASEEREKLLAIEEALKRIDEGNYGICNNCSEPISKQRLQAVPQTETCIKCQEKKEDRPKKGKA